MLVKPYTPAVGNYLSQIAFHCIYSFIKNVMLYIMKKKVLMFCEFIRSVPTLNSFVRRIKVFSGFMNGPCASSHLSAVTGCSENIFDLTGKIL
jgi:hypothetical protein